MGWTRRAVLLFVAFRSLSRVTSFLPSRAGMGVACGMPRVQGASLPGPFSRPRSLSAAQIDRPPHFILTASRSRTGRASLQAQTSYFAGQRVSAPVAGPARFAGRRVGAVRVRADLDPDNISVLVRHAAKSELRHHLFNPRLEPGTHMLLR